MLYYIFRYFEKLGIPGSGMWSYISFRSLLAFITALLLSWAIGKWFITFMHNHRDKVEEKKFDAAVDPAAAIQRWVPSMGGIVIIASVFIACLFFGRLRNIYLLLMLLTTVWLGLTGFADDFLKIKRDKNGLAPAWKLLSQLAIGIVVALTLYLSPDAVIRENVTSQRTEAGTEIVYKSQPVKSFSTFSLNKSSWPGS